MHDVVMPRHFVILGANGVEPLFGAQADQIVGRAAVTGQRQRVCVHAGAPEHRVDRAQIEFRAAESVDQKHGGAMRLHADQPRAVGRASVRSMVWISRRTAREANLIG
jgi:hypothetical protein